MAKVTLGGTINIQGTKEIDRTNLAQLREPATITWSIVAGLRKEESMLMRQLPHLDTETLIVSGQNTS